MRISYTPFLHAKEGEFVALQYAKNEQLAHMLPLFEIAPFTEKTREQAQYRNSSAPICAYIHNIVSAIYESFPNGPVMVDTVQWQLNEITETGVAPVAYAINALQELEQPVVPVVGLDRWESPEYQLALKTLSVDEEATWAIRLDASDIEDAADPDHFLERIEDVVQELGLLPRQIGFLLDFGDVFMKGLEQIEFEASRVLQLLGAGGYQFFSLIGCSMPPTIDRAVKKHNTEAVLPRKEVMAWQNLRAKHSDLPLTYGDYGVRGPGTSDIPNGHTNGKIRYTIEDAFFIARGESRQNDKQQMYRLANLVASSEHYQGPDFSWGDKELYRRAIRENIGKRKVKIIGPGGSNEWIQFDTSHHLAWVHVEIAAIEHALAATPVEVEISAN
jgi:hypothetical protein